MKEFISTRYQGAFWILYGSGPNWGFLRFTFIPDIGIMVRVFANGPGDLGSIPGRIIPETQKIVLGAALLNPQHYKVWIKGEVGQSWERGSPLPNSSVL